MLNRFFWFFLSCFSLFFGEGWVFSVGDSLYPYEVVRSFYGPSSWDKASVLDKNRMVDDFLIREGAFLSAREQKLHHLPSVVERLYNKKRQLLVNYVYQIEIAKMGRDSVLYRLGKENLKEDRFIHHILIGYDGSSLRRDLGRNREEAFLLSSNILDTLQIGSFKDVAARFSDDGTAKRNLGALGWVSWGATVSSFEVPIFSAPLNVLLGPIETSFGYHLAYVEKKRASSFSLLSDEEFLDAVLMRSSPKDVATLRATSSKYDSLQLFGGGLVFNDSLIIELNNSLQSKSLEKVNKNDVVATLRAIKKDGVVCVFKNEGLGLDWFINRLELFPSSGRPSLKNLESFYSIFKTLLLQEEAVLKGSYLGYDLKKGFKKQLLGQEKDMLYTLYFKNLVNSVPKPDSLEVKSFYLQVRETKYVSPKSLKFQEVRVGDRALADSLLNLYIDEGVSFDDLVEVFSVGKNALKGGFVGPFEKSFNKGFFSGFFKDGIGVGYVGNVVDNFDGSFSFFKVVEVFPRSYIPFEKVYGKASSLLYREKQEKAKSLGISNFYKDLNIVKNDSLF